MHVDFFHEEKVKARKPHQCAECAQIISVFLWRIYGIREAIIEKYLRENPVQWDRDMAGIGWNAMASACKLR
jgi:hypothetical protein